MLLKLTHLSHQEKQDFGILVNDSRKEIESSRAGGQSVVPVVGMVWFRRTQTNYLILMSESLELEFRLYFQFSDWPRSQSILCVAK